MRPRRPDEEHRSSTPLELLFDLVFVVAVSFAAQQLAAAEEHGRIAHGLLGYAMVFFAIWWAWVNFTWFASAFDTDDWLYRLTTLVQMGGALVIAAGVPRAMVHEDFTTMTLGYVLMRVAGVFGWLRAARQAPAVRSAALRYAAGVTGVQVLWLLRLALPPAWGLPSFVVLAVAEVCVPIWAEWRVRTTWHPDHIADRYGGFTLIVLGESVLAATNALVRTGDGSGSLAPLVVVAVSGLALLAAMWWVYFARPQSQALDGQRHALVWSYGHYLVFAAAGGVSAGLEVAIAHREGDGGSALGAVAASATTSVPAAMFLLATWALLLRPSAGRVAGVAVPVLAVLVGASALVPGGPVAAAALAVVIVVVLVVDAGRGRG